MAQEKQFENRVKDFLKSKGCYIIKYWGGGEFTKAGVPDLLVCCNGLFLGIELKADKGKPSELQKYNLRAIEDAGGYGILLYPKDYELFKQLIIGLTHTGKQTAETLDTINRIYDVFRV